jgi:hypothetical protein
VKPPRTAALAVATLSFSDLDVPFVNNSWSTSSGWK